MKRFRTTLAAASLVLCACLTSCTSSRTAPAPALQSTVEALLTQVALQSTQVADQTGFLSYLATRMPVTRPTPGPLPFPTPFVHGSLFINDGKCCIAGIAGEAVLIPVVFQAASPAAEVTEMRSRAGSTSFTEQDLTETEWEPFSPRKVFEYIPPLNWSGFYITVQYRDALGNTSPVYSSDISVEGMPAGPIVPTP
jgi:hypothetical protein